MSKKMGLARGALLCAVLTSYPVAAQSTTQHQQQLQQQQQQHQKQAAAQAAATDAMDAPVRLTQGRMIATRGKAPDTTGYTFGFFLRPQGISAGWTNVVLQGPSEMSGWPSVDFYPGQTRLHIRSNTASGSIAADPASPLPANAWTHVAIIHTGHELSVYLNGKLAMSKPSGPPAAIAGPIYASDPWREAANAQVFDMRYYPNAIDLATLTAWVAHHP